MPKRFRPLYSKTFIADLEKLDPPTAQRILDAIEEKLLSEPLTHSKKLSSQKIGQWRFRVGNYRIRFDIGGNTLYFYRVRHRKEIYR